MAIALAKTDETPKKKTGRVIAPRAADRELLYRPTVTGWTPELVLRAEAMADNGNLRLLSDLWTTMSRDGRIKGVLSTRTQGLLGLPMEFKRGSEEAREQLEGLGDGIAGEWWYMHSAAELVKLLQWGLGLGVGLAQRIELPRLIGQPHRYTIRTWDPRWLQYMYYPEQTGGSHWRLMTQEGVRDIFGGDGEWIMFTPYGETRPWSQGLWNSCAFPWLLKRFSLEDRAGYAQTLGEPIYVGTTTAGGTQRQRDLYLRQLRNLGKSGKVVLPAGWDLKLVEATGQSNEVFKDQIQWANEEMTISIAGQVVTTEGTSGFSSGNIFQDIKADFIRFDGDTLSTCLKQQSTDLWALMNYGSVNDAPWGVWETQRPQNIEEQGKGLSALGDAITKLNNALAGSGIEVDVMRLCDEMGLPVRKAAPAPKPTAGLKRKKK